MTSQFSDTALILTPIKDAQGHLERYFELILQLTYPRSRLSLGLLESDSSDNTYHEARTWLESIGSEFRSTQLWKKDFGFTIPEGVSRWSTDIQIERRSVLARRRSIQPGPCGR